MNDKNFTLMQSTSSDAQITQAGQAIAINDMTCTKLAQLFAPMFGPNGNLKALINGGKQLTVTKDGIVLCKDVQFNHSTAVLITRAASSLYQSPGDGTIGFVLMCCNIFSESFKYFEEIVPIPLIVNSIQLALKDATDFVQRSIVPLTDERLRQLALCSLRTKIFKSEFLVDIVLEALLSITSTGKFDIDMVEIMKMKGGDVRDSIFVNGLVLDHSGRHHEMPTELQNVCVLISNMSLEYEKPEINAEFYYSSALERVAFVEKEREFILSKARHIANFALELKKDGKSLILINEKGIDPYSLEILSKAGVLALRRAKRRNLERITNMCGGKIVTETSQISRECLGYCQSVKVKDFGENKYTFMEVTPFKGSCTIFIRGNVDSDRLKKSIQGTLQSLMIGI